MTKRFNKLISLVLTLVITLSVVTIAPISASAKTTLDALRSKYPHGSYWNSSYNGRAWQCHGFALQLGYELTDSDPYGWGTYYGSDAANYIANGNLKPGDIINKAGSHVILFAGWADALKTKMNVYEQTPPKCIFHTVNRSSYEGKGYVARRLPGLDK